jgi:O-acetyl-ADP-ribose deacetylase (regulator of RNase III)
MPLTIREGDATHPIGAGTKIIVHVCNDVGGWGRGFVLALSRRWPAPEEQYRGWYRERATTDFALGAVQFVPVEDDVIVANLIGQEGLHPTKSGPPVRYEAIREGLARIREHARERSASVHMPRIGCGLADGRWEEVEAIVRSELVDHGVDVTVYDLPA